MPRKKRKKTRKDLCGRLHAAVWNIADELYLQWPWRDMLSAGVLLLHDLDESGRAAIRDRLGSLVQADELQRNKPETYYAMQFYYIAGLPPEERNQRWKELRAEVEESPYLSADARLRLLAALDSQGDNGGRRPRGRQAGGQ